MLRYTETFDHQGVDAHAPIAIVNVAARPGSTLRTQFTYEIEGRNVTIKTEGVCATIIDYTLSRLQLGVSCFVTFGGVPGSSLNPQAPAARDPWRGRARAAVRGAHR